MTPGSRSTTMPPSAGSAGWWSAARITTARAPSAGPRSPRSSTASSSRRSSAAWSRRRTCFRRRTPRSRPPAPSRCPARSCPPDVGLRASLTRPVPASLWGNARTYSLPAGRSQEHHQPVPEGVEAALEERAGAARVPGFEAPPGTGGQRVGHGPEPGLRVVVIDGLEASCDESTQPLEVGFGNEVRHRDAHGGPISHEPEPIQEPDGEEPLIKHRGVSLARTGGDKTQRCTADRQALGLDPVVVVRALEEGRHHREHDRALVLRLVDELLQLVEDEQEVRALLQLGGDPYSAADTEEDPRLPAAAERAEEVRRLSDGGRLAGVGRLPDEHNVQPGLGPKLRLERDLLRHKGAELREEEEVEERERRLEVVREERGEVSPEADHRIVWCPEGLGRSLRRLTRFRSGRHDSTVSIAPEPEHLEHVLDGLMCAVGVLAVEAPGLAGHLGLEQTRLGNAGVSGVRGLPGARDRVLPAVKLAPVPSPCCEGRDEVEALADRRSRSTSRRARPRRHGR